jgi:hypothetical protein
VGREEWVTVKSAILFLKLILIAGRNKKISILEGKESTQQVQYFQYTSDMKKAQTYSTLHTC